MPIKKNCKSRNKQYHYLSEIEKLTNKKLRDSDTLKNTTLMWAMSNFAVIYGPIPSPQTRNYDT